ncbi:MAG: hypothetical protein B7Y97_05070 [Sphingomonas sp. 32-66-10]|nr:MAG: hypothetical protein B7Y97_05070 [Sphingomonas sp. 32-66-10]
MQSVYIVDDDQAVRQSLHGLLSERPNLVIRVFASGDAFLDNIEASDGGVLLLDFQMPGRNGIEVMRAIQERSGKFLTIMLTGQGDISLAVQAMKAGATDFLEKPYDPHHLLNLLDLSPRTVEIYRANMMEKLDVSSLSEALRLAYAAEVAVPV